MYSSHSDSHGGLCRLELLDDVNRRIDGPIGLMPLGEHQTDQVPTEGFLHRDVIGDVDREPHAR
jgi:hypothetical protein